MKSLKQFVIATGLSILVFFSVSFLTVLAQINPLHYYVEDEQYNLSIGYPWVYYKQFFADPEIPNSSWQGSHLIYDCILTWIVITGLYVLLHRTKKNRI
jgi:hypothetical protein